MSAPRNMDEAKIIREHLSFTQSTHSSIATDSAAVSILKLSARYFKNRNETAIEIECNRCLEELQTIAKENSELRSAIHYTLSLARKSITEFIPSLITVTLPPLKGEKKEESKERAYVFHPNHVLTLVWKALQDSEVYTSSDHTFRKETFFNSLKRVEQEKVCIQGVRHDWISTLNKIHPDVNIIEDLRSSVLYFVKDNLNKLFWEFYEKTDKKKSLLSALYVWMSEDNPSEVVNLVDPDRMLLSSLKKVIEDYGCDSAMVDAPFQESLSSLQFSCDADRHPYLYQIHKVFELTEMNGHEERNKSVVLMQEWIRSTCQLEEMSHRESITQFRLIYLTYSQLVKYDFLLEITGKKESVNFLWDTCLAWFKEFNAGCFFPTLKPDFKTAITALQETVRGCEKDNLFSYIENFFARWYAAEGNVNILIPLYKMLLDEEIRKKIILSDELIKSIKRPTVIREEKKEDKSIPVTPYEINRVFLHAIVIKPSEWSSDFADLLENIFLFIQSRFNISREKGAGIADALKRDSYPDVLLFQMEYLINLYKGKENNPRPEHTILLPENVRLWKEWYFVSLLLTEKQRERFYSLMLIQKNFLECVDTDIRNQHPIDLAEVFKHIPREKRKNLLVALGAERLNYILQDEDHKEKLIEACWSHSEYDLILLLAKSVYLTPHEQKALFCKAYKIKHQEIVNALITRKNSYLIDGFFSFTNERLIQYAIRKNDIDLATSLLRCGADPNQGNLLDLALNTHRSSSYRWIDLLVSYGAKIKAISISSSTRNWRFLKRDYYKVAHYLLEKGATIYERYAADLFAEACFEKEANLVLALLKRQTFPMSLTFNWERRSPLMEAIRHDLPHEVLYQLLEQGCHYDQTDRHGKNALIYALLSNKISVARLLIVYDTRFLQRASLGMSPLHVKVLLTELKTQKQINKKDPRISYYREEKLLTKGEAYALSEQQRKRLTNSMMEWLILHRFLSPQQVLELNESQVQAIKQTFFSLSVEEESKEEKDVSSIACGFKKFLAAENSVMRICQKMEMLSYGKLMEDFTEIENKYHEETLDSISAIIQIAARHAPKRSIFHTNHFSDISKILASSKEWPEEKMEKIRYYIRSIKKDVPTILSKIYAAMPFSPEAMSLLEKEYSESFAILSCQRKLAPKNV